MTYDPTDMRSIINAISESALTEAPISQRIKNGITRAKAALGSNTAAGEVDSIELANKMDSAFKQYLGRTGKKATPQSLASFLISPSVGYGKEDVIKIMKPYFSPMVSNTTANSEPTETNAQPENTNNSAPHQTSQQTEPSSNTEPQQNTETQEPSSNTEPNEADDSIDEAINQLLTYTKRQYAENMKPEIGGKIKKAMFQIIHNLPEASADYISKGGNAALDACAVLERSNMISDNQYGSVQLYLNKILSMNSDSNIPAYNTNNVVGPDDTIVNNDEQQTEEPTSSEPEVSAPSTPSTPSTPSAPSAPSTFTKPTGTKPKVTLSTTGKPKVKVQGATESIIYEDVNELSSSEIYDIFKSAAQYAYANDLVGHGGYDESDYDEPRSYGGRGGNSRSSDGRQQERNDKEMISFEDKAIKLAAGMGLTSWDFQDARGAARKNQWDILDDGMKTRMSQIGYAFLKSMKQ